MKAEDKREQHWQLIKLPNTFLLLLSRLNGTISLLSIKKYSMRDIWIDCFPSNAELMDATDVLDNTVERHWGKVVSTPGTCCGKHSHTFRTDVIWPLKLQRGNANKCQESFTFQSGAAGLNSGYLLFNSEP